MAAVRAPGLERPSNAMLLRMLLGGVLAASYLLTIGTGAGPAAAALAIGITVIALVWPIAGLTALAVILPQPEPDVLGPIYVTVMILGATVLGSLLIRAPGSELPRRIHPSLVLAVGYVAWSALSIIPMVSGYQATWVPSAVFQLSRLGIALGLFLVSSYLFRWVSRTAILWAALLGGAIAAMIALMTFWQVGPLELVQGLLAAPPSPGTVLDPGRATGGFSSANYLGFFACQYALLGIGMWAVTRGAGRGLLVAIIVLLVTALMLSFSRSSLIGLAVGALTFTALRSVRLAVALAVVMGVAALTLYPLFLGARLDVADPFDPLAVESRLQSEYWRTLAAQAGLSLFQTDPMLGVGFGVFERLSAGFIIGSPALASHNVYVQILAEQGAVGAVLVAATLAGLAWTLWRSESPWRGAALAMLVAFLAQSLFINSTQSTQVSGITWIVAAAAVAGPARPTMAWTEER